jgi:WD40 repeat protein/serine/threonine protein kinase
MSPDQWREIKPILLCALDLAPAERDAYLASCDPTLRAEVELYLRSYEASSGFLDQAPWGIPSSSTEPVPGLAGKRFGPYQAIRLLGHGGMGSVWLAERVDGLFTRQVALKLIHPALAGWVMTERLAREREILANLAHPNIARLLDAGSSEDGQSYLALEYVDGTPLTSYCDSHHLSVRQRLRLFRQVMDAVQYAHAHLIVHRDLKPSNVLVTAAGQVQLLDFGIAKLVIEGEAPETELTQLGGRPLTPDYAAPEQIIGASITTAADVYGLGVMLHELLTGERPYRLRHDSRGALEDAILNVEATAPSRVTVSADSARVRGTTPQHLAKTLKGDIDVILSKALKKVPAERYATVNAFTEDIERYLRGEPLLAQRDSITYRANKFVRRHWVALSVVSVLILTLAAGLLATMHEASVASRLKEVALQAQFRSLTQTAAARLKDNNLPGAMGIILQLLPNGGSERQYTPEALSVLQEARAVDKKLLAMTGHSDTVQSVAFSPDGLKILTASDDRTARVWDAGTGQQLLVMKHAGRVTSAAFSPDGKRIVTASLDKTARVWDAVTGQLSIALEGHTAGVWSASFSPDGQRVLTASSDKTARIWDIATGQQILALNGHGDRVWSASFSPDGSRVVTASFDRSARIWDAASGRQITRLDGHTDTVSSARYSPDGLHVITASFDHTARLWDARTGQQKLLLTGHSDQLSSAAYSPDGTRIVTASFDKSSRIWDADTGEQIMVLGGQIARVNSAAFSPSGRQVAVGSYDGNVYVWDTSIGQEQLKLAGHAARVWSAAYSPDGLRIVTASLDHTARIWNAHTGQQLLTLSGHTNSVPSAVFAPDGQHVLTGSNDGTAVIWDSVTGDSVLTMKCPARVWDAVYSPDGRLVATASDDGTAQVWDVATGKQTNTLRGHAARVVFVAFSPDGRKIVTTSVDKTARIWDSSTGRNLMQLRGHEDVVEAAVFSPDGRLLATASDDTTVRIWDSSTGLELRQLDGHEDVVQGVTFSSDGKRIVTASADKTARIWDAATGRELKLIGGFTDLVATAVFSNDGRSVLTASDKTARIWDAGAPPLNVQLDWSEAAQFDPLSTQDRYRLGLPHDTAVREWPSASSCDRAAAAAYDPDRRWAGVPQEEIVPEIALTACANATRQSKDTARTMYQHGRAAMAKGDNPGAMRDFEQAAAQGYRAARFDLAALLLMPPTGRPQVARAISLYEQAWKDGIATAAFNLGNLYEQGVIDAGKQPQTLLAPDPGKASSWYESGTRADEPNSLAYAAERASRSALSESEVSGRDARLLESFKYYAAAVERARREDWPDATWKSWRYRRASIARLLARDGMTEQVAQAYQGARGGVERAYPIADTMIRK